MPNAADVVLEVSGLTGPDESPAIFDISLTAWRGRTSVVLGPIHSGKSIVMRHLLALEDARTGSIVVEGERFDARGESDAVIRRMRTRFGVIFEGQPIPFMLVVMAVLLVVGCFLDPGAAIVLFVPLLMPVARAMGIDDLQFSMVVILTLTIGLITPPVGVCLFVACRIGAIPVWRLVRAVAPFLIAEVCVVLLLVFFPVLSSGLPGLLR